MRYRQPAVDCVVAQENPSGGDPPMAVDWCFAHGSRRADYLHRLGVLRYGRHDWAGAAVALEAAVKYEPHRLSRLLTVGRIKEHLWDYSGARTAYERAARLAPKCRRVLQRLGSASDAEATFRAFDGVVVAHRGSIDGRPENAIESLDDLPEIVQGVEVDVRLSKDNVAVLLHDEWVDRTTDGHGPVSEMRYDEIRRLSGSLGARVPMLAAYLEACEERGFRYVLLDLKTPTEELIDIVTATVREAIVAEACVIMVREESEMRLFREKASDLRLGAFGTRLESLEQRISAADRYQAELLVVAHGDAQYLKNRGVVPVVKGAGLAVGASIVNRRRALEATRVDGCDLIVTDRAAQLAHFKGHEMMQSGALPAGGVARTVDW